MQNFKRRERDLNPRNPCGLNGFQDRRNRPLCHLSFKSMYFKCGFIRLGNFFILFANGLFCMEKSMNRKPRHDRILTYPDHLFRQYDGIFRAARKKIKQQPRFRLFASPLQGHFISDSCAIAIFPAAALREKSVPNPSSFLGVGAKSFQAQIQNPNLLQPFYFSRYSRHFSFAGLSFKTPGCGGREAKGVK